MNDSSPGTVAAATAKKQRAEAMRAIALAIFILLGFLLVCVGVCYWNEEWSLYICLGGEKFWEGNVGSG